MDDTTAGPNEIKYIRIELLEAEKKRSAKLVEALELIKNEYPVIGDAVTYSELAGLTLQQFYKEQS